MFIIYIRADLENWFDRQEFLSDPLPYPLRNFFLLILIISDLSICYSKNNILRH